MINWPQISIDTDKRYDLCFGCGQNNPIGLKLDFTWDGQTARAEFTPNKYHQGWPDIVHGGILACLLDEALGYATLSTRLNCVSAKIEINLKRPARIDEPLVITGTIMANKKRLVETKANVSLADGTPVAEATALMYVVSQRQSGIDELLEKRKRPHADQQT